MEGCVSKMLFVKVLLQLVLFGLFVYFYGIPAVKKMNQNETIVVKSRRNTQGIKAPSVTIAARNNQTNMGWKEKSDKITKAHSNDTLRHQCEDFSTVEDCLTKATYNHSEFIKGFLRGYERQESLLAQEGAGRRDFTYVRYGTTYTVNPNISIGPVDDDDQIIILLDRNFIYDIFIHDKDFFILNDNRCGLPALYQKVIALKQMNTYYKMYLIDHHELNVPEDPCQEGDDYR